MLIQFIALLFCLSVERGLFYRTELVESLTGASASLPSRGQSSRCTPTAVHSIPRPLILLLCVVTGTVLVRLTKSKAKVLFSAPTRNIMIHPLEMSTGK